MTTTVDGPAVKQEEPSLRQLTDDLVLVEVGGKRIAIQSQCPHRKGLMRYGRVNPRTLRISCPLHYSTFDLVTGRQVAGPPCGSLGVNVIPDGAPLPQSGTGGEEEPS
ncbi:Rieske (2Fe-2S) protein [Sphaerisporangium sp. NPDC051017]|uniref:Rieske (2Fe-2S) protein n=1 Tax=Sphaerisporangium sp. NPDC051017 TaxID=3154636 RepID=UPI00343C92EF